MNAWFNISGWHINSDDTDEDPTVDPRDLYSSDDESISHPNRGKLINILYMYISFGFHKISTKCILNKRLHINNISSY